MELYIFRACVYLGLLSVTLAYSVQPRNRQYKWNHAASLPNTSKKQTGYHAFGDYLLHKDKFPDITDTEKQALVQSLQMKMKSDNEGDASQRNQYDGQDIPNPNYLRTMKTKAKSAYRHYPWQDARKPTTVSPMWATQETRENTTPYHYVTYSPKTSSNFNFPGHFFKTPPHYYPSYTRQPREDNMYTMSTASSQRRPANHLSKQDYYLGGDQNIVFPEPSAAEFEKLLREKGLFQDDTNTNSLIKLLEQTDLFNGRTFKESNVDLGALYAKGSDFPSSGPSDFHSNEDFVNLIKGNGAGMSNSFSPTVTKRPMYTRLPQTPPHYKLPREPKKPTLYPSVNNMKNDSKRVVQSHLPYDLQKGIPLTEEQVTKLFGQGLAIGSGGSSGSSQGIALTAEQVKHIIGQSNGGSSASGPQKVTGSTNNEVNPYLGQQGVILTEEQVKGIFGQQISQSGINNQGHGYIPQKNIGSANGYRPQTGTGSGYIPQTGRESGRDNQNIGQGVALTADQLKQLLSQAQQQVSGKQSPYQNNGQPNSAAKQRIEAYMPKTNQMMGPSEETHKNPTRPTESKKAGRNDNRTDELKTGVQLTENQIKQIFGQVPGTANKYNLLSGQRPSAGREQTSFN